MPASLALRKLGRLAGLVEAGLLPLDDPCVSRQEAGSLERLAEIRIGFDQRAGDAVADCSGLPARPAAVDADADVKGALDSGDLQRRERELTVRQPREVLLDLLAVEPGIAVARAQDHARHGRLALARSLVLSRFGGCRHASSPPVAAAPGRREDARGRRRPSAWSAAAAQDGCAEACLCPPCGSPRSAGAPARRAAAGFGARRDTPS